MKRTHLFIPALLLCFLFTVFCKEEIPTDINLNADLSAEEIEKIRGAIQDWVTSDEIVGAEVLILKSGEPILHETFGMRDMEREIPVAENTICRIRSMTKPFIGTSILMLEEEGKLSLDDKVMKYLPVFDNDKCRDITIKQFLTHTGGYEQPGYPGWALEYNNLMEIAEAVANAGPTYEPGERYSYSDGGSSTLAAIVAEVSGMPVEDFINERIFEPLNMNDSYCLLGENDPDRSRVSCTYNRENSSSDWIRYWDNFDTPQVPYFRGSGGIFSTPADYAKFLDMWMKKGYANDIRFLQEETIEAALTPSGLSRRNGYGYGYHWEVHEGVCFGHGGSDGTIAMAFPEKDITFCFFTQSRGNRILRQALNMVIESLGY
ncbi:MAG: beta-lactamase family protein [bacterium]|nr:beta-lactamase family protein [bacterium]